MSLLPEILQLSPREEGERLWKGAMEAFEHAGEDFAKFTECLDLGIRAAEILAALKLQPARNQFPATIGLLLETPSPEINLERDTIDVPKTLRFEDILDMLSAEDLTCISPTLHHGWEDPRFSCLRSRRTAQEQMGIKFDQAGRDQLLFLLACRNRILRMPPPVRIPTVKLFDTFPTLGRFVHELMSSRIVA